MKKYFLSFVLLLTFSSEMLPAQQLAAYQDVRGFFHVFDDGRFKQLESLPVKEFRVARNFLLWVNNVGQFKIYEKGYVKVLRETAPRRYVTSDHLMAYELGGQLFVYERQRSRSITNFASNFILNDSVIAFFDFNQGLNVYYRGRARNLEVFDVRMDQIEVGKNVVAYVDNIGQFAAYWAGEKYELEHLVPREFRAGKEFFAGRNVMAYVDNYGRFKIFHKGMVIDADPLTPRSFQVGDDMVAWVNRNNQFMVFDDGIITMVEDINPEKYRLIDGVIAYELANRHFKAYYQGETHILESYIPEQYKIDNQTLAWVDYMNNLHALSYGELIKPAKRIVSGFDLVVDVIQSNVNMARPQFYYDGTIY